MPPDFTSHASTAETLALGTESIAILADGARTNGQLTCVEVWVPPAGGPPLHRHTREDEAFYVLEGTLTLIVEGQHLTLPAGTFAWAPRDQRHRFVNNTASRVRMLVFILPAGIEGAFREGAIPVPPGTRVAPPVDHLRLERFATAAAARGLDLAPKDSPTTPPITAAYTRSARDAETISLVGDVYALLATGAETAGQFYLHEGLVPPGGGPPPHTHTREDEAFYILEGTLTLEVEGRRLLAPPHTFVWAPRNQRHRFVNESRVPVHVLVIGTPAGIELMFRQCGISLPPGSKTPAPVTPDAIAKVMAAAAEHGIVIDAPTAGHAPRT